ncbi:MAG: ATP-binding protein [Prolixibacteraceae bacterium]
MINKQNYKILHLEDLPTDAGLAEREISKVLENYTLKVVETEEDFRLALDKFNPDIVISDFKLPSFDGMSALKIVLEKKPTVPVIILTGSMNEDTAVECIKAGAMDYVIKEHIKRLGPAILNALEQKKIKHENNIALQQIKLLGTSIEKSPVSVVVTNSKGELEYVNPKFNELTGYSAEEVLGKNMSILKSGKHSKEFYSKMWEAILTGEDWKGEIINRRKSGKLYWESMAISSILDENGEISHFIGIKEDISEKKNILKELTDAKNKAEESERLKTAFLHNISHEIRTPMNSIVGFTSLLNEPDLTPELQNQYVNIITHSSDQLLSIISDIISIATIEAGQAKINKTEFNINGILRLLHDQFLLQAEEKGISFDCVSCLTNEELFIVTDEIKLTQILSNLISNALKFTNKGSILLGYKLKNNELEFFIKDTGIGIPLDMFAEIFDRFRQMENTRSLQFGGSGLGLSISKAYVELLGGKMWLKSEINKGSTFFFTIPKLN